MPQYWSSFLKKIHCIFCHIRGGGVKPDMTFVINFFFFFWRRPLLHTSLLHRTNVHSAFWGTHQWLVGLWSLKPVITSPLTFKVYLNVEVVKTTAKGFMTEVLTVLTIQAEKFKFSSSPHWDTICSIKCLNDAKNYFDPNSPNCTRLSLVFEFKQTFWNPQTIGTAIKC